MPIQTLDTYVFSWRLISDLEKFNQEHQQTNPKFFRKSAHWEISNKQAAVSATVSELGFVWHLLSVCCLCRSQTHLTWCVRQLLAIDKVTLLVPALLSLIVPSQEVLPVSHSLPLERLQRVERWQHRLPSGNAAMWFCSQWRKYVLCF